MPTYYYDRENDVGLEKYAALPTEVLYHPGLSPTDKIVLCDLIIRSCGSCKQTVLNATNQHKDLHIRKATIIGSMRRLEDLGFITFNTVLAKGGVEDTFRKRSMFSVVGTYPAKGVRDVEVKSSMIRADLLANARYILMLLKDSWGSGMTTWQLVQHLNLTERSIRSILKSLCAKGLISKCKSVSRDPYQIIYDHYESEYIRLGGFIPGTEQLTKSEKRSLAATYDKFKSANSRCFMEIFLGVISGFLTKHPTVISSIDSRATSFANIGYARGMEDHWVKEALLAGRSNFKPVEFDMRYKFERYKEPKAEYIRIKPVAKVEDDDDGLDDLDFGTAN